MDFIKRSLILLLALCCFATMLSACSGNGDKAPAATTETTTLPQEEIPPRPAQDQDYEQIIQNAFALVAEPDAEHFTYTVSETGVTLTGYTGELPRLKIPAEIEGKPVVAIADSMLADRTSLTALVIPETVQSIGKNVLKGCTSLVALKTPMLGASKDSAQYLGYLFGANSYETNSRDVPPTLEILELSEGLFALEPHALYHCNDLLAVKLPQSIKQLGAYSLFHCERLQYVNVAHLSEVSEHAMDNCKSVTHLNFGVSLTSIGLGAMEGCVALESLTLPFVGGSATENRYLAYVFGATVPDFSAGYYPQKLIEINLLSSCTSLGNYAFYECTKLVYLMIEEGLSSIGVRAFDGCERLRTLSLPNSLQSIGDNAFFGCLRLESIAFGSPEASALSKIGINAFYDCISLKSIVLPTALTALPASCFADCSALVSVDLGGVRTVGKNAFRGCSSLIDVIKHGEVVFEDGNEAAIKEETT